MVGWMDGTGWILLRSLVQLEHLAVLITYSAEIRKALASLFKRPKLAQADQV